MLSNRLLVVVILSIAFLCSAEYSQEQINCGGNEISAYTTLKPIHEAVFDLYLPELSDFTEEEKKEREAWKKATWYFVAADADIRVLLEALDHPIRWLPVDLQILFPDILKQGFSSVSPERQAAFCTALRRHSSNDVRKIAAQMRLYYVALCYACPLINKRAGITVHTLALTPLPFEFPASQLILVDHEIRHKEGPIDFLIAGSGPAGSLIAYELMSKHPKCRIVMVEAGSFVKPGSIVTESASALMEKANKRLSESGGLIIRNGWTVGGGTTVNLDLAFSPLLPLVKRYLQQWVEHGAVESAFFHGAHKEWQKVEQAYRWVTDMIGTRTVTADEINANNALLLNGAKNARTYDLNEKPFIPGTSLKISAVHTFLLPALCSFNNTANSFSLIPDVKVKRILFECDKESKVATGVQIEMKEPLNYYYVLKDPNQLHMSAGTQACIKARHVILSAGTLVSAEILLRSNLNNPEIGKGIVVHPSIGLVGRFDTIIDPHKGLSCAVYAPAATPADDYFFESMGAEPSFIPLLHQGDGKQLLSVIKDFRKLGGFGVMLIDSVNKNNCVTLDPVTDKVVIEYTLHESDKERMRNAA
jgi:hypothetical protein